MSGSPSTIRVAILGGGLAGAAILRGLLRYPHIAVDMYDSRPNFSEEGLGIELTQAAQDALHAIDPTLEQCLDRAGAVNSTSEIRVATGPHRGQKIPLAGREGLFKRTVSRQALLAELLSGIPPRMMHTNTRLSSIMDLSAGGGVLLTFADGTQKQYDVIIGADGAYGDARRLILGDDDPTAKPRYTGFWALPIRVPLERAQEAMGAGFLDPHLPRSTTWIGEGTMMRHDLQSYGNEVQITAYGRSEIPTDEATWARIFTPDEFRDMFAKNELQACQGMVNLIQSVYTVQVAAICQMQHPSTVSYARKNACLVGDSAHAMLPFHGVSTTIEVEEALILSTLLGRLSTRSAVPAALQAFDRVCRPRAELVVRASQQCGMLLTGSAPGVGVDANLITERLGALCDGIASVDVNAQRQAAVNVLNQIMVG
ncbi:FAD/NAD(P)-binding domain-containing protein [Xylariomycetidae sp. FL2044]|nr:FAD/NAD(P)-binding domain-containing protein [Xylariomycetidae sp. FL2044]